jgi:hypothetical protein
VIDAGFVVQLLLGARHLASFGFKEIILVHHGLLVVFYICFVEFLQGFIVVWVYLRL